METEKSFVEQWRETVRKDMMSMGNPHWEKWKVGRPTKVAKEKRKLAQEWYSDHDPNFRFIKNLPKERIARMVDGKLMMKYKPRRDKYEK